MGQIPPPPPPRRVRKYTVVVATWTDRDGVAHTREVQWICECGRDVVPGARFCDGCGAPAGYTGTTERLDDPRHVRPPRGRTKGL